MATIHKLTKDGSTIFPATITDAVVHPNTGKTLTSMIKDYNVSELFPSEGIDGGNKYNLALAISVLGSHLTAAEKTGGIKLTFISSVSPYPEEEYYLQKSSWSTTITDWGQRFEVGGVIADPGNGWEPSTAEVYIDEKVAEINTVVIGESIARQQQGSDLQTQINAEVSNRNQIDTRQDAELEQLRDLYEGLTESDVIVGPRPSSGQVANTIYREPDQGHTPPQFYADYMWYNNDWVLMAQYDNGIDDNPLPNSNNLVKSSGVFNNMGAFDISAYNSGAIYQNLSAALNAVPQTMRAGGMSVKFIQEITPAQYSVVKTEGLETQPTGTALSQDPNIISGTYTAAQLSGFAALPTTLNSSLTYYLEVAGDTTTYTSWVITYVHTSDNNYVQARFMLSGSFTAAQFTNVANWQGVDAEPNGGSRNLVESGGVHDALETKTDKDGYCETLGAGTATHLADEVSDNTFIRRIVGGDIPSGMAWIESIKGNTVKWNQLYNNEVPTAETNHKYFISENNSGTVAKSISTTISYTADSTNRMCIDLTQIFGSGNEPSTVEVFESWLATNVGLQDYYAYNAGSLIPVKMTALKSTSFNLFDKKTITDNAFYYNGSKSNNNYYFCSDYIPVKPGTDYYLKNVVGSSVQQTSGEYDKNKRFLRVKNISGSSVASGIIKTSDDAYFIRINCRKTSGNAPDNVCVNLSNPSKNGNNGKYFSSISNLNVTQIKGKLLDASGNPTGNSVVVFPDGLKKAGDVFDEIFVENGVVKAVKRVGSVDLGTLTWTIDDSSLGRARANDNSVKFMTTNMLCIKYRPVAPSSVSQMQDKQIFASNSQATLFLRVQDSNCANYTDNEFKSAMSGVYLYYELATYQEYILEGVELPIGYKEENGGTEEVLVVAGETEGEVTSCAPTIGLRYPYDAKGEIENIKTTLGNLDVSLLNADTTTTPITLATYADLSAALAAIPAAYQSGGMRVKFVRTDNKYVQYRLMTPTWSAVVGNWEQEVEAVKLRGITAEESRIVLVQNANWYDGKYVKNDGTIQNSSTPSGGVPNGILIVNVSGCKKVRFLGFKDDGTTTTGYGFSADVIDPTLSTVQLEATAFMGGASAETSFEYIVDVPDGMNYFACTIRKYGTPQTAVMTLDDFYCYTQTGNSVYDYIVGLQEETASIQNSLSFPVVYTDGVFNANNIKQRFEIPTFRVWIGGVSYLIEEQNVEYFFTTDRRWFFLVLSQDFTTVEILPKVSIGKENQSRIIAIFYRTTTASYTVSYFCGAGNIEKWRIDGVSNEQIESISDELGIQEVLHLSDACIFRYDTTVYNIEAYDNPNGNRIRIVFRVVSGDVINVVNNGQNIYAAVFDTLDYAAIATGQIYGKQILTDSYVTDSIIHSEINVDGYLSISLKNDQGSVISDSEMAEMLSNINVSLLHGIKRIVYKTKDTTANLLSYPLSNVNYGQNSVSGDAAITNTNITNRVSSVDCLALPYNGVTLHFRIPEDYMMAIRLFNGYNNTDASTGGKWFIDGESYKVNEKYSHFMFSLAKKNLPQQHAVDGNYVFDVDEINRLIRLGEIEILYEDSDVNSRYMQFGDNIKSTTLKYTSSKSQNIPHSMPTIIHCSDIHGDAVRWRNILQLNSKISADAVINTGDNVAYSVANGVQFLYNNAKLFKDGSPIIVAIGNHDTNGDSDYRSNLNSNLNSLIIAPFADDFGYTLPESQQYDDAPTYYYKDLSAAKIRIITLNLYDTGQTDWAHEAFSQKQINWLISVLESTPQDYGVVIDYHRSLGGVEKDSNYDKFWQESSTAGYSPSTWSLNGVSGTPIQDIVDAFIGKTTLQSSFTVSTAGGNVTINVDADFTSVASGVEFIAHIFGHHHRDTIGYYSNTVHSQLCLCVCQSTAAYSSQYTSWAGSSDLPRIGGGREQDAFNVYTIDRVAKTVRVAKFGSIVSSETLKVRDCMIIPYA